MSREITDREGTVWNCVQAYAGLNEDKEKKGDAASVKGSDDLVQVIATPSGSAQTVRLELRAIGKSPYRTKNCSTKLRKTSRN